MSKPPTEPNEPLIPAGDPIPVPLGGDFAGCTVQFNLEAVLELDFVAESLTRAVDSLPPTDDPAEQRRRVKEWCARRAAYLVWRVSGLRAAPARGDWEAWAALPLIVLRWITGKAYQEAGRQALSVFRTETDVVALFTPAADRVHAGAAGADAPVPAGVGAGPPGSAAPP